MKESINKIPCHCVERITAVKIAVFLNLFCQWINTSCDVTNTKEDIFFSRSQFQRVQSTIRVPYCWGLEWGRRSGQQECGWVKCSCLEPRIRESCKSLQRHVLVTCSLQLSLLLPSLPLPNDGTRLQLCQWIDLLMKPEPSGANNFWKVPLAAIQFINTRAFGSDSSKMRF